MSSKPDVSQMRRAQIIEAATAVFTEKGLDRATMAEIADAAGINKATIYLYFDSKAALTQAIAEAIFAQELADLQAAYESPGTAIERLTAFYEALIRDEGLIADKVGVLPLMPIIYEFYALGLRRDDVRAVLADFLNHSAALLAAIIQEGIESGEFVATTDPSRAARALDELMSGTVLHWVYTPEEVDVNAQFRYGIQLIFQGLIKHK